MRCRKAGFPFATRARKREPCSQRYVLRMTRTDNFPSQVFFHSFSGNHFSPRFIVLCSLLAEFFFGFSKSAPTPPYTILNSRFPPCNCDLGRQASPYRLCNTKSAPIHNFGLEPSPLPPCNAISEGRLPLCNTSSEAGALLSEVRIENDSDRQFSKSSFF